MSTAVNQLGSRALARKPKAAQFTAEATGRSLLLRSSVETHKLVYGRAKVSGPLVYAATGVYGANVAAVPKDNKLLYLVVPLAAHECDAIETVYLNDRAVAIDPATGLVTTAPYLTPPVPNFSNANVAGQSSFVLIRTQLGAAD